MFVGGSNRTSAVAEFFGSVRGALSVYCDSNDGTLTDARFILCRYGEDPDKVVATFWREHQSGNFSVVPLFAHGLPPRSELCSQRSLAAALQTATIEPGGTVEQQWKAACEAHNVAWPKRLAAA
jgi:hypothetical protein